jgi:hypothetical protein
MAVVLFGLGSAANHFATNVLSAAKLSDYSSSAFLGAIFRRTPPGTVRRHGSGSAQVGERDKDAPFLGASGATVGQQIGTRRVE